MKIQIVKGHLVRSHHLKALVDEMEKIISEYDLSLPNNEPAVLHFSSHLTTAGAQFCYRYRRHDGFLMAVTIKINVKAYRHFGFENALGSLRHELAHWLDYVYNGNPRFLGRGGHSESFKKICADLGGTMNKFMAGEEYASCATAEFLKTEYKWEYTCPTCGVSFKAKRRRKRENRFCHHCKTPFDQWKENSIG